MSTSNEINEASHGHNDSNIELDPKQNKWLGRKICGLDKFTCLLGATLTIIGIVLFILNALYTPDLYIAAAASISSGSVFFLLGLIYNCCRVLEINNHTPQEHSKGPKKTLKVTEKKNIKPLTDQININNFFEERGIFGVPQSLIDEIEIWRKYRTSENFEITLDAGFILDGPPGTGKTTIAEAIAEILGGEYIEKKCGELNDQWHGNTEKNITNLFAVAEEQFRVVVIDEISGLLPKRTGRYWNDSITEHFLGVVSGTAQKKPRYILIGTTNNFESLDPALVRRGRLGKKFTITNPDRVVKRKILFYHLFKSNHSIDENWANIIEHIVNNTEGYSGADIIGIISDAQRKALLANRDLSPKDFVIN